MHNILKSLADKLAESAIESHIGLGANLCGKILASYNNLRSLSRNGQNLVFLPYLKTSLVCPVTSVHNILKSLAAKLAESAIESHIGLGANLCGKCLLEMRLSARDKKGSKAKGRERLPPG